MEQKTQEKGKNEEKIIRIMSTDIEGKIKVYPGLAKVKGISWAVSNAICKILKIDKTRKIGSLTSEEMKKITEFMKNPAIPEFLKNRKLDFERKGIKYEDVDSLIKECDFLSINLAQKDPPPRGQTGRRGSIFRKNPYFTYP